LGRLKVFFITTYEKVKNLIGKNHSLILFKLQIKNLLMELILGKKYEKFE